MQHPIITNLERYGEPYRRKNFGYCDECGIPIEYGDDYYNICSLNICSHCIEIYRKTAGEDC